MKIEGLKSVILVAAMGLMAKGAMAQESNHEVPQAVNSSFMAKYPGATEKGWSMKHDTCMVKFSLNNQKYMACYSPDGNWISTERTINHKSNLPPAVRSFLKNGKYASWHVDKLERVETPSRNLYKLQIDNHDGNQQQYENAGSAVDKTFYLTENGRLVDYH